MKNSRKCRLLTAVIFEGIEHGDGYKVRRISFRKNEFKTHVSSSSDRVWVSCPNVTPIKHRVICVKRIMMTLRKSIVVFHDIIQHLCYYWNKKQYKQGRLYRDYNKRLYSALP